MNLQTGVSSSQLGTGLERRISSFPLLMGLQLLQQCSHRCLLPGTSCRCKGQAVSVCLHCLSVARVVQKSQIFIVWLTPLLGAEGSTAPFGLGRDSNGRTS